MAPLRSVLVNPDSHHCEAAVEMLAAFRGAASALQLQKNSACLHCSTQLPMIYLIHAGRTANRQATC